MGNSPGFRLLPFGVPWFRPVRTGQVVVVSCLGSPLVFWGLPCRIDRGGKVVGLFRGSGGWSAGWPRKRTVDVLPEISLPSVRGRVRIQSRLVVWQCGWVCKIKPTMPCTRICFSGQHPSLAGWSPLRKPVMAAVGLRSDFSKCFFRGFQKAAVFENQSRWFRDGNPVVQARPLHFVSLNRASPMPSLRWGVALFAPPNNGMHRTRCCRFHQWQVAWALLAGDARRWVAFRLFQMFFQRLPVSCRL